MIMVNDMKKALFITTVSGFLYQFEMSNVKLLQDMGYEVHLAANGNTPGYIINDDIKNNSGVIFHHTEISKSPKDINTNRKAKDRLVSLVRNLGINLIHCHTPVGGVLGRMVGRSCEGVRVIYTTHGFHYYNGAPAYYKAFDLAERKLAVYTDALITINKEDYRRAKSYNLKPGGRVYRIPGEGTDTYRFSEEEKTAIRPAMRGKLGLKENDFFLLSTGELNANKNHETVIKALSVIKDKRIFYGICGMGSEKNLLKETILKTGIRDRVRLFGYRSDIKEFLYAADAFAFPSVREGLGMAAIEAMASGLPVIAADNRGTREYMKNNKNGFVCPALNASGFAANIKKMQNLPEEKRQEMGKCSRETAKQFDIKNVRPIMKKIYEEIDKRL